MVTIRNQVTAVIAGVVVPLVVMVTLVAVGAIIIAGYIVHKRSKKHRGGCGTASESFGQLAPFSGGPNARSLGNAENPVYDQNAMGTAHMPEAPVLMDLHNTIYEPAAMDQADYEVPVMAYESPKRCSEQAQYPAMYATLQIEPLVYK